MAFESRLELKIAQRLILTPQLQQAIKMLQLPRLELSQFLTQELVENPLLEESLDEIPAEEVTQEEREFVEVDNTFEDIEEPLEKFTKFTIDEYFEERSLDGRDLGYFNPGTVSPVPFENIFSKKQDLYDYLLWQLRLSSEHESIKRVGELIIGNIDENGYLRATIDEIIEETKTRRDIAEKALKLIQSFDPPGVGARDVKECLLLQLQALNLQNTIVEMLIKNNLNELKNKKYAQIAHQYNLSIKDIISAIKVIEGLEPKPGRNFSSYNVNLIIPDVYVVQTEDGYQIILNEEGIPKLKISSFYKKLLKQSDDIPKEERQFFIEKFRSAVGLLKSLDQRNRTIYRVTESLIELQRDFFDKGVDFLKPLTLKDVASMLRMHESTISRVTSNKYLSCSHGVFSFKFLFSSALQSGMGDISSRSVKNFIKKIVTEEDPCKPCSDQYISNILKKNGIIIARRTVAKYRDEMGIPSQIQRRKIS